MISTLAFATCNPGKRAEFAREMEEADIGIELYEGPHTWFPPETGRTYLENALIKGRHAAQTWGVAVVAEDSGIEVPALSGLPGVHSARFAGYDVGAVIGAIEHGSLYEAPPSTRREGKPVLSDENNELLLRLTRALEGDQRLCQYVAALVVVSPEGRVLFHTQANVGGRLLRVPQGTGGFGYDPIVSFHEHPGLSVAQLSMAEKNAVSHRGQVMRNMLAWLRATQPQ